VNKGDGAATDDSSSPAESTAAVVVDRKKVGCDGGAAAAAAASPSLHRFDLLATAVPPPFRDRSNSYSVESLASDLSKPAKSVASSVSFLFLVGGAGWGLRVGSWELEVDVLALYRVC